jgi:hypothetical protein
VVIVVLGAGFWIVFRRRSADRRSRSARMVEPDLAAPVRDRPARGGLRGRLRRPRSVDPRSNGHGTQGPLAG